MKAICWKLKKTLLRKVAELQTFVWWGGNFIPHTVTPYKFITNVSKFCDFMEAITSLSHHLVSWITLRLSFPPAVSIDIWLLLFIKSWKIKNRGRSYQLLQGVTHNFKKMWTCSKTQYTNSQTIFHKKKSTLKHTQHKPSSMFNNSREGGGVLPMMAHTGRLRPKGLPSFFRLQVYERVGISLVEVYKRVGNSVIWVCKRANRWIL